MLDITNSGTLTRIFRDKKMRTVGAAVLGAFLVATGAIALSSISPPSERLFVSRTGYTLRYPAEWIVEDVRRDSSYESELIREPRGYATIAISSRSDQRLRELTGRAAAAKEIELAFTRDKTYQLDFFGWLSPEVGAEYNGYVASGSFENDDVFVFRELGILDPSGIKQTFRSEVRSRFADELVPVADAALLSVRTGANKRVIAQEEAATLISAEGAKALIERLPDFALYRDAAVNEGATYVLKAEDAGAVWNVRLYVGGEKMATPFPLERWRVDKVTGAISKVLP